MSAIKAGDLVIVTGAGCIHAKQHIGLIFQVFKVDLKSTSGCMQCDAPKFTGINVVFESNGHYMGKPIHWVRKIDPLNEPETVTEGEEITA